MNKKSLYSTIFIFCFFISLSWSLNEDTSYSVVDGVTFRHWHSDTTGILHNIAILKVDYHRKDLEILAAMANPSTGRERTSDITREWHGIAGINGGYFNFVPPAPVGLVEHDGKIITS